MTFFYLESNKHWFFVFYLFVYLFIYLFIYSFIHSFVYLFIFDLILKKWNVFLRKRQKFHGQELKVRSFFIMQRKSSIFKKIGFTMKRIWDIFNHCFLLLLHMNLSLNNLFDSLSIIYNDTGDANSFFWCMLKTKTIKLQN